MQARLDLTMAYWANNQRQEAIDELLAMIKADRAWNEEAARQQLLKFFEALFVLYDHAVDAGFVEGDVGEDAVVVAMTALVPR